MPVSVPTPDVPSASIRLLIVTAVRLYRDSLADILGQLPEVQQTATANDGASGLSAAQALNADLVLFDMSMPDAVASVHALVHALPGVKVVALGVRETEDHVLACAEAGICAYVPREASLSQLQRVLRHAMDGEALCSPLIAGSLIRRIADLADSRPAAYPRDRLTAREREVLALITLGMGNRAIAARLGIQVCTAKNHVHNVLEKLGVSRREEAAALSRQAG